MGQRDGSGKAGARQVMLMAGSSVFRAQMQNLSRKGCLVECSECVFPLGSDVQVGIDADQVVAGRIAWRVGSGMGIEFVEPLPIGVVRATALDDWMLREPDPAVRIPVIRKPE